MVELSILQQLLEKRHKMTNSWVRVNVAIIVPEKFKVNILSCEKNAIIISNIF